MGVTFTGGVTPPTELLLPLPLRATFAMINSHAERRSGWFRMFLSSHGMVCTLAPSMTIAIEFAAWG